MFIGIDIGGTFIKGVLTDKSAKVLSTRSVSTPTKPKDIENTILSLIESLATSATVSKIDIKHAAIGCAGTIDRQRRRVIVSPNIPLLKNYSLAANLEKKTGINIVLENDATVALMGSWWKGHGNRYKNWLLINIGSGIGGGAIIDNKIYQGAVGNALEVGHISIDYNGHECSCGNRGCLEKYVSAKSIINLASEKIENGGKSSTIASRIKDEPLTSLIVYEEALNKDELAISVFEETGVYLGYGLVNLINIFSPEAIIIGGAVSGAHKFLFPEAKRIIKERALPGMKEHVNILPAKNPNLLPSLGAVKIAMDSAAAAVR